MTVARLAISLDRKLADAVRRSAGSKPISAWLADAAQRKLRAEGLAVVVREWEAQHGEITAAEVKAASLGRRRRKAR